MDEMIYKALRRKRPTQFTSSCPLQAIVGCLVLVLLGSLVLTGCQTRRDTTDNQGSNPTSTESSPEQPTTAAPSPDTAADLNAQSQTANPAEVSGPESGDASDQGQAGATLPDSLLRQWEPASNVLFTFGPMTITSDKVLWSDGPSSPYTVISTDGGYLLQLESNPAFYETQNPYIKLIPKTNEAGNTTSLDIAFYESTDKVEANEYIMYGSYFVE